MPSVAQVTASAIPSDLLVAVPVQAALDRAKGLAYARPDAKEAVADAPLVVSKPLLPACQTPVHLLSAEEEEEQKVSKAKGTEVAICVVDGKEVSDSASTGRLACPDDQTPLSMSCTYGNSRTTMILADVAEKRGCGRNEDCNDSFGGPP